MMEHACGVWVEWIRWRDNERGGEGESASWRGPPVELAEAAILLVHGFTDLGWVQPLESTEVRCLGAMMIQSAR